MKKLTLCVALLCISYYLLSQNWIQIGDLNDTPRIFLNDTMSDQLYISGNFRFNGIDTVDGFCSYNGSNFTSYGRRFDCSSFGCNPAFLLARYGDYLYFSGSSLTIIDNVVVEGIAQWDGTLWLPALPGLYYEAGSCPSLDSYCIHDGLFYGVGVFRTAQGDTCNSVAYWDGQKWTGLGFLPWSDNSLPRVSKVIFYQNQLYVGGNFSWAGSGGQDIARLDNTGWHMVGGGLYGGLANVFDMEVYKGELYICGYFRKLDGNVGNKIMRWNGLEWNEVGAGFCASNITPTEMMVYNNKLYVVGNFSCVQNDISASEIATWDGERWCNLGDSYFNNTINCITEYHGEIYVGGGFTEVDGQPCRYLAKWVGDDSNNTCSDPVSAAPEPAPGNPILKPWPNPTKNELHLQVESTPENIRVFDALGREMPDLRVEVSEGMVKLDLGGFPVGLYYVTVQVGGRLRSGKFVRE